MAQLPHPAAIHGAAAEDSDTWEEALDVDDSDLRFSPPSSSALRPRTTAAPQLDKPSRPSHGERIPGPASTVQDAMRFRDSGISPALGRVDIQAADADFLLHPWRCAMRFLGKDSAWERPGIKRIKANQELRRAPLVVGVVTSCKPNGLGDLFLTLKDPTDTIGASVHRNALSEGNVGQDISVGCVVLLSKVAVYRPSHTTCYLNITKGKVAKVVRKDCEPPFKHEISSGTTESQFPASTWKETQWVAYLGDRPLGRSEGTTSTFSKLISRSNSSEVTDLYFEGGTTNYIASQQSLNKTKGENPDTWHQTQGGSLPMFERGEAEGSANIIMGRLGHEKIMTGRKEITVADVSCHHQKTFVLNKSTTGHKSSSYADGYPQQSFNILSTCSQPGPGARSVPGDTACTQASNSEKLRLPLVEELMLPSNKKLKTNTALPDCYEATMNTLLDTKSKNVSENSTDIDVLNMAEAFYGAHSSTGKLDEHKQNFCAVNTGTAQPTQEKTATCAAAADNNNSLLSSPKSAISVVAVAGFTDWTDEQISELFADY